MKLKLSRKMKIAVLILVIVLVSMPFFQLYESDSEPSHQLTLSKDAYNVVKYYCPNDIVWNLPQNYTINCSSYSVKFLVVNEGGFGHKELDKPFAPFEGFSSLSLFLTSCKINGTGSYISFEVTGMVTTAVNETYGNCTITQWCVLSIPPKFFPNVDGLSVGPSLNCNYRYNHVSIYNDTYVLPQPVNFTAYYAITLVPVFHYNYLFHLHRTGKPITIVYHPNRTAITLYPDTSKYQSICH